MIKTHLMRTYGFNTAYKFAADYDVLIRLYKNKVVFEKIETIVVVFELGGTSSQNSVKYLMEMNQSKKQNHFKSREPLLFSLIRLFVYNSVRSFGIRFLSRLFYSEKQGWFSDRLMISDN